MVSRDRFTRNAWRRLAGLPESDELPPTLAELRQTEWSQAFEALMRNRLILGAFRYGRLGGQFKPQYDRTQAILLRTAQYAATGNLELLVDVANLAMLEFVEGRHPRKHFRASDDGAHVEVVK